MGTSARGLHPGTLDRQAAANARGAGGDPGRGDARLASLLSANVAFLSQAAGVLERIDDAQYGALPEPFHAREGGSRGGIGGHLRHILDHYHSLLDGLGAARVDYSLRARDRAVESERGTALLAVRALIERLGGLDVQRDRPLSVSMDSLPRPRAGGADWLESSLGRELQFLASHTVHHYAIIAILLRLLGIEPGHDFGVAPSTLAFERGNTVCAR